MNRLILICLLPILFSFTFSPMTSTLNLKEDGNKAQFQLKNTTNKPIPIVISIKSRIQNEDGSEDLPNTDKFQVIPPQLIVPPNDQRTIRLKWEGEKNFDIEKSFRVIAEQVPLNIEKEKKSGIQLLLKYQAALYVISKEVKADLKVIKFKNGKKLKVWIKNFGSAHQYLNDMTLSFSFKKQSLNVPKKELKKLDGQNILAKTTRVFEFSNLAGLNKSFKAKVKTK